MFVPGTTRLPAILPITLPIKYGAVILPVLVIMLAVKFPIFALLAVIFPLASTTVNGGIPIVKPPSELNASDAIYVSWNIFLMIYLSVIQI